MKKQRNHLDLFDRDSVRAIRITGKLIFHYDLEPTYHKLITPNLEKFKEQKNEKYRPYNVIPNFYFDT